MVVECFHLSAVKELDPVQQKLSSVPQLNSEDGFMWGGEHHSWVQMSLVRFSFVTVTSGRITVTGLSHDSTVCKRDVRPVHVWGAPPKIC